MSYLDPRGGYAVPAVVRSGRSGVVRRIFRARGGAAGGRPARRRAPDPYAAPPVPRRRRPGPERRRPEGRPAAPASRISRDRRGTRRPPRPPPRRPNGSRRHPEGRHRGRPAGRPRNRTGGPRRPQPARRHRGRARRSARSCSPRCSSPAGLPGVVAAGRRRRDLGAGPGAQVTGVAPPLSRCSPAALLMVGLAWCAGPDALMLGLLVTVLAALVWRLADGPAGFGRDLTAGALDRGLRAVPAGFGALLAEPPTTAPGGCCRRSSRWCSRDTGGYAAGVFFGKHPMAPTISPKKSWEGFAGSVARCSGRQRAAVAASLLDVPLCWGRCSAPLIAAAVLGDLARVDAQARHRHQGHEPAAARARRADGPAGLDPVRGAHRVPAALAARAAEVSDGRRSVSGRGTLDTP